MENRHFNVVREAIRGREILELLTENVKSVIAWVPVHDFIPNGGALCSPESLKLTPLTAQTLPG